MYPAEIAALARQRPLAKLRRDSGEVGAAPQLRDDAVGGGAHFLRRRRRIVIEGDFRNKIFGRSAHGFETFEFLVDLLFAHGDSGTQAEADILPPRDLRPELVEHRVVGDAALGEKGFEPAAGDAVASLDPGDGFLHVAFRDPDALVARFFQAEGFIDEVAQHGSGDTTAYFAGAREVGVIDGDVDAHFEVEDRDRPVVDHSGDSMTSCAAAGGAKPRKAATRRNHRDKKRALLRRMTGAQVKGCEDTRVALR